MARAPKLPQIDTEERFLAQVAWAYHVEGLTQNDVAQRLNINRVMVVRLLADGVAGLPALWRLVSANPAAAMGLHDRGRIAQGLRADLVLLDWPDAAMPAPLRLWSAGRAGYAALPSGTASAARAPVHQAG